MSLPLVDLLQRNSVCHSQLLGAHYAFFFFFLLLEDIDKFCEAFKSCNSNLILVQNDPDRGGP
jgi:hypothetical protein